MFATKGGNKSVGAGHRAGYETETAAHICPLDATELNILDTIRGVTLTVGEPTYFDVETEGKLAFH